MDKKLLGYILVAAAVYYMLRRETAQAGDATTSELDVMDVNEPNNHINIMSEHYKPKAYDFVEHRLTSLSDPSGGLG